MDGSRRAFVSGYIESADVPATPGALDTTFGGAQAALVAAFEPGKRAVLLGQPQRLVDTRATGQPLQGYGAAQARRYQVGGQAGVPADAAGVLLNMTVVGHNGDGWLTAWPAGQPQPAASTLNVDRDQWAAANAALVRPGAGGQIDVTGLAGTHLIFDVVGYLAMESGPVHLLQQPQRLVDTRTTNHPLQGYGEGQARCYPVAGQAGVPPGPPSQQWRAPPTPGDPRR